jgi:hypothetical protein
MHHDSPRIDLWARTADGWRSRQFAAGEVVPLDAIGCTLSVDDVYAAARAA